MTTARIWFDENGRASSVSNYLISVKDSDGNAIGEVMEVDKGDLSSIFEGVDVDELAGTGQPIEAAVDDPLTYRDFLILEDGEIVFDDEYEREVVEDTE